MEENREQEADPGTALAGILQGFRLFCSGLRMLWRVVCVLTPWATVTLLFLLLVAALVIIQLLISLYGAAIAMWNQPWFSSWSSTGSGTAFATPTRVVSGLSTGVTACGAFLSTQLATLAAASASAPGVASLATGAFEDLIEDLGPSGLKGAGFFLMDWPAVALNASKDSATILDNFYTGLRHENRSLTRVDQLTKMVADRLHAEVNDFIERQRRRLEGILPESSDDKKVDCEGCGLGAFLERAVEALNGMLDHGADEGPELASFVRDLRTAQGAGSMFNLAFSNAIGRLRVLSRKTEKERGWVREMEERLTVLSSDIAGNPDAVDDLLTDAKAISSWVEAWRRTREELYFHSI